MEAKRGVEHVRVSVKEDRDRGGRAAVRVYLGEHYASKWVYEGWFYEWRLKRTIDRLSRRVMMFARRERDWILMKGSQNG